MGYRFGECRLNHESRELFRRGINASIRPQTFDVLVYLIAQRHRVVAADELLDQLWPGKVVTLSTLTSCIKEARRAVGDNGTEQNIIRTVHGRGYQFVAPLEEDDPVPTSPDAAEPAAHATNSEYKPITVLVCGLVDGKALATTLGPEAMHHLMQQFIDVAQTVTQEFSGTIRRLLDDGIEVLFGVPEVQEDHARRAVLAALALRRRWRTELAAGDTTPEQRTALAIGIHTGQIILGTTSTNNPHLPITALGDTLELAHLQRRMALPDTILLSAETLNRVRGEVRVEAIEQPVNVTSPPLTVYQLRGTRSLRSPLTVLGKRTLLQLVGRDAALMELRRLWEYAKQGRGQVVGVTGEAGLGKSRLLFEFHRRLRKQRPVYLEGRCVPHGQATPYLPVLALLRHCSGIATTDTAEIITAKVRNSLQQAGMEVAERAPYMLYLLGVADLAEPLTSLSPQLLKTRTFQTLEQLFISRSRQCPLVLEVEDLHWIDATSEEFLHGLIGQLMGAPILLLVSYRPGYQPPWMGKSYASQLALQPLDEADSSTVLHGVLKKTRVSEHLLQALLHTAEGNPLFLEELAWSVVEQGEQGPPLAVPATIQAVLLGRIDRLHPATRQLVQVAAVLGKEQSLALLQAVTELPEDELHHDLGQLQATELLYVDSRLAEPGYTFKHALTREAAYQALLQNTRQDYHQKVAEVLAACFPETAKAHPEWLAHHFTEAGCHAQAVPYWLAAGQHAIERSSDTEAIALLSRGLSVLENLPEGPERFQQELALRCTLGIPMVRLQGYAAQEVKQNYDRAQTLSDQLGDSPQSFQVLLGLWMFYGVSGSLPTALKLAEQMVHTAREDDTTQFIFARAIMGLSILHHGNMIAGLECLEEGIARYDRSLHQEMCVQYGQDGGLVCLFFSAHLSWWLGYPERAMFRERQAIELAETLSHPFSKAFVIYHSATHRIYYRDFETAQTRAEMAIDLSQEQGFPFFLSAAAFVRGWALVQRGESTKGIAQMEESIAGWLLIGTKIGLSFFMVLLAEAYGAVGKPEVGLITLTKATDVMRDNDEHFYDAGLRRVKGELLLLQTVPDERQAEVCFQEALNIARRQQAKSLELQAAMSLCRLWRHSGKRDLGFRKLAAVYSWFTEGFDTPDLREARALLDECHAG